MLGYSLEEIKALGSKLFEKHVSEYTCENLFPKVLQELGKNDPYYVIPLIR